MPREQFLSQLDLRGILESMMRNRISGHWIIKQSLPPDRIATKTLEAIAIDTGSLRVDHLTVGSGPNRIEISRGPDTGTPQPQIKAYADGVEIFNLDVHNDLVKLSIGQRLADGTYPIMVKSQADGEGRYTFVNPTFLLGNNIARSFIASGVIDLIYGGGKWEDAGSTGMRLSVYGDEFGITLKKSGTVTAKLDANDGEVEFGPNQEGRLNQHGAIYLLSEAYHRAHFAFHEAEAPGNIIGLFSGYRDPTCVSVSHFAQAEGASAGHSYVRRNLTAYRSKHPYGEWAEDLLILWVPANNEGETENMSVMQTCVYPIGSPRRSYCRMTVGRQGYFLFDDGGATPPAMQKGILAHFAGGVSASALYADIIGGGLQLADDRIGITEDKWITLGPNCIAVVYDNENTPSLRVKRFIPGTGLVQYIFEGIERAM